MTEGGGEITGGIAVAGGSVDCRRVGNVYAGATRIYAGCAPSAMREFHDLAAALKELREETDDLDRQIDYLKSKNGIDPREISDREKARAVRVEKLKEGAGLLKEMRHHLEAAEGTTVTVRDRVFPGASIYFGLAEFPIGDRGLERAILRWEHGRIAMHGYVEKPSGE